MTQKLLLLGLICLAPLPSARADDNPRLKLRDGDIVALCGDSITSDGWYPRHLETYQLLCCPQPKTTLMNFGRWGEVATQFPPYMDKVVLPAKPTVATICYGMNNCRSLRVMTDKSAESWGESVKVVAEKFKAGGARVIVLASPGCIDSTYFALSQNAEPDLKAIESTQKNLSLLRDSAKKVAARDGYIFADMHTPMVEVMAKAQDKYGKEYAFAGGKGDGVHPGPAGHLVMAWVYLKALGYDGDIGTITVNLANDQAKATDGHKVVSCKGGVATIESTRSPFCFLASPQNPKDFVSGNATRSVADLFPFNDDLNRMTLIVEGSKAKTLKVTWGQHSKEFDAATLAKGINLAAEFLDNPFCERFSKSVTALVERNNCRNWLKTEQYKNSPMIQKRLEVALKTLEPVAVTHQIRVETVP